LRRMEDVMETVQVVREEIFMNILENCYIYKESHLNNELNDKSTLGNNNIFESIIQYEYTR
jgi:hypothetical protein